MSCYLQKKMACISIDNLNMLGLSAEVATCSLNYQFNCEELMEGTESIHLSPCQVVFYAGWVEVLKSVM